VTLVMKTGQLLADLLGPLEAGQQADPSSQSQDRNRGAERNPGDLKLGSLLGRQVGTNAKEPTGCL